MNKIVVKGGAAVRRIVILLLCLFLLTTAVHAAGSVTDLQSNAFISADGTCQISLELSLTMDGTETDLRFPLPGTAKDITLNGGAAKTSRSDSRRWVDLSSVIYGAGKYTVYLHYSLPDLVTEQGKGSLVLTLPLLSGFAYPIDHMGFSITLPGAPEDALIMGNVSPATQFRNGTPDSIREATLQVMYACCSAPNFVISSGCDIPPLSSWENIDAFFQAANEFYSEK